MGRRQIDIDWILENHSDYFAKFNLNEVKIREHYEVWKVGKLSTSVNDYYWYLLQNIIAAIAEQVLSEEQIYQLNYETYLRMWEFLVIVEYKNGNHVKRVMHENQLRLWELQSSNFKKEVVIISGSCCLYCNELNGKKIDFEEALEKQYLASESCTREYGCNCSYAVLNCRDENGRLIRIN